MITLNLIVSLFQFNATTLQFNLHQWQAVNEDGHVITTFLTPLNRNLIGNLKLILAPILLVEELEPHTLPVLCFQRE